MVLEELAAEVGAQLSPQHALGLFENRVRVVEDERRRGPDTRLYVPAMQLVVEQDLG